MERGRDSWIDDGERVKTGSDGEVSAAWKRRGRGWYLKSWLHDDGLTVKVCQYVSAQIWMIDDSSAHWQQGCTIMNEQICGPNTRRYGDHNYRLRYVKNGHRGQTVIWWFNHFTILATSKSVNHFTRKCFIIIQVPGANLDNKHPSGLDKLFLRNKVRMEGCVWHLSFITSSTNT